MSRGGNHNDFQWRPRTIDESVDPGVHPAVAAMRLAQKGQSLHNGQIVGGMDLKATPWMDGAKAMEQFSGYTYNKRNGPANLTAQTHTISQLDRLAGLGANPQDYFKQAKQLNMNPAEGILAKNAGPGLPTRGDKEEKDKKDKGKKKKDKKKKKEKEKKKKSSKKKKKKKDSSSSSSSESSSSSSSSESDKGKGKKRKK